MTPLERLLMEELPTGQWGGPRPNQRPRTRLPAISPEDAAHHLAELAAALAGWEYDRDHRHLQAVPDTESEAA